MAWNWYFTSASAEINMRLQLSDTSFTPPMHGGFLLVYKFCTPILLFYRDKNANMFIGCIVRCVTNIMSTDNKSLKYRPFHSSEVRKRHKRPTKWRCKGHERVKNTGALCHWKYDTITILQSIIINEVNVVPKQIRYVDTVRTKHVPMPGTETVQRGLKPRNTFMWDLRESIHIVHNFTILFSPKP